jgi:Tfp pilus assembly protein PilV
MSRGYILVEASVAYSILGMALVALIPLFILCFRSSQETSHIAASTQLSAQLLEEVRVRRWDSATGQPPQAVASPSATLGCDPGESPGDKRTFNDIDDFQGWAERQPLDPGMEPVAGLEGYSRTVAVDYVTPTSPDTVSPSPTDLKRVIVCSQWRRSAPVCVQTLFANR